ncbi:hypothetical protein KEM52_002252 [Ascosphaera acerosa]|nr:hypothetical protein KEM52_002252 [Ascosphaera acerosa]
MANTVNSLPKLVPSAPTAEEVRSYLFQLLTLRHDYTPDAAHEVVKAWKRGGMAELVKGGQRILESRFGHEVGRLLYRDMQKDVLTDFMNSFHGLFMTGLLAISTMVAVVYGMAAYVVPKWEDRTFALGRVLFAAGPVTFVIINQFPWCTLKMVLFCTSLFFSLVGLFALIARMMKSASDKEDQKELAEHAKALQKEQKEQRGHGKQAKQPAASEDDDAAYNLRQRKVPAQQ